MKLIGDGAQAKVYLVQRGEHTLAEKAYDVNHSDDYRSEVEILKHIGGHPNICEMVPSGSQNYGKHAIVFKHISGGDLFDNVLKF